MGCRRRLFCRSLRPVPLFLIAFTLGMIRGAAGDCQLQGCWNLFQSAQEMLGVREILGGRDHHRNNKPTTEELHNRCVASRTFYLCIRNMTGNRGCVGDLSFHSAHRGAEKQMKLFHCNISGPVFEEPANRPYPAPEVCSYTGQQVYKHCGLFGDPHLRTFNDEFQTCKVQGAWPLIDNQYLIVQVTNDPVGPWDADISATQATATSKLTVMIKRNDECAGNKFLTYQAQTDYLPSTFDDGRAHVGPEQSVKIVEVDPGKHVEIFLRYIDTTLVLRQIGRYFTFAIKMPEEIVNQSQDGIQLCTRGCPKNEIINYGQFLAHRHSRLKNLQENYQRDVAMTRDMAEAKCRAAGVVDFYFHSCVFDLMTTGDTNFTLAAHSALQDVLRLYPQAAVMHKNQTDFDEIDKEYSANSAALSSLFASQWCWSHRTTSYILLVLWTCLISYCTRSSPL